MNIGGGIHNMCRAILCRLFKHKWSDFYDVAICKLNGPEQVISRETVSICRRCAKVIVKI